MLNNFIYAQTKDLFVEALEAGNILDEAIVFIEDTKEIWTHGHYFDCSRLDPSIIPNIQTDISDLKSKKLEQSDVEIQSITYNNLATLKAGGKLVPGKQYMITDYYPTVSGTNVSANTAMFSIIVTALESGRLSEKALLIHPIHPAFEIQYCFENDTTRFAWAKSGGRGVIYRMIDTYGNDCPYDFLGIKFLYNGTYHSTFGSNCMSNIIKPYIGSDGRQALNYCTFGDYCSGNILNEGCHDIHLVGSCLGNTFNQGCFNITMGVNCQGNAFDTNCHDNLFGQSCSGNEFDTNCHTNSFGDNFSHNKLMLNCYNNTFGVDCVGNVLDASCYDNVFGIGFSRNTLGRRCFGNSFGENFTNNTIRNEVQSIDFSALSFFKANYIDDNVTGVRSTINPASGSESNPITNYYIKRGVPAVVVFLRGVQSLTTISSKSDGGLVRYIQDDILGDGVATSSDIDAMWSNIINGYYSAAAIGEFEETEE